MALGPPIRPRTRSFLSVASSITPDSVERASADSVDAIRELQQRCDRLEALVEALSLGGGADASLFDTILNPGAISFGPAFDNWNPGALGQITLIRAITDGASRNVQGLVGGVVGKIICLMNIDPAGGNTPTWVHLSGSASAQNRFVNSGGLNKNGQSFGCVWYYYDSTNLWRNIMDTQ